MYFDAASPHSVAGFPSVDKVCSNGCISLLSHSRVRKRTLVFTPPPQGQEQVLIAQAEVCARVRAHRQHLPTYETHFVPVCVTLRYDNRSGINRSSGGSASAFGVERIIAVAHSLMSSHDGVARKMDSGEILSQVRNCCDVCDVCDSCASPRATCII